jgi:hypothetical protein
MPIGDVIFLTAVIIAFVSFAIALGWGQHQTRGIGKWPDPKDVWAILPEAVFAALLRDQRMMMIIIAAAITPAITATMTPRCKGLLSMCRSKPNRVPSGNKSMPHLGHLPELDWRTSECMGQT